MDTTKLWETLGNDTPADVLVMAMAPDGTMYSLKAVEYEEQSSSEGNVTSTGDTVWLKLEEV